VDTVAAEAAVFVSVKLVPVPTPLALAVMVYVPATVLAVTVDDVALPLALVVAMQVVADEPEPQPDEANVALAPLPGAANVTVTPATGLPAESLTTATSGLANAAPALLDCADPDTTAMLLGAPEAKVTVTGALVAVHVCHTATTLYVCCPAVRPRSVQLVDAVAVAAEVGQVPAAAPLSRIT
jgi:hypothetical protein